MRSGRSAWPRTLLVVGASIGISVSTAFALVRYHEERPHASTPTLREYDSLRADITAIKTDVELIRHYLILEGLPE